VIAAYEQLLMEGYLKSHSGSGTWVADVMQQSPAVTEPSARGLPSKFSRRGAMIAKQPQFGRRPHKINFKPGFPEVDAFPFPTWARLLVQHARSRSEELLSYYHFAGNPALREAIAEYVDMARGVDCRPEQVIVVTGAQAALVYNVSVAACVALDGMNSEEAMVRNVKPIKVQKFDLRIDA
jgi:GntR family transcriptional regulator / MocR family aminotransferase